MSFYFYIYLLANDGISISTFIDFSFSSGIIMPSLLAISADIFFSFSICLLYSFILNL